MTEGELRREAISVPAVRIRATAEYLIALRDAERFVLAAILKRRFPHPSGPASGFGDR